MANQSIEPGDLVPDTVARIELAIVTGELRPGQRLAEPALSARFGISRSALREAIRSLEGRRLLARRPNAGVRVVDLQAADIAQLLIMREALEGIAARYAAENMTLPEARALRQTAASLRENLADGSVESLYRGGTEYNFHRQIIRGSRNTFIEETVCRDMYPLLRIIRFRTASMPVRRPRISDEHMEIVDAIEHRRPDDAERLMREHIVNGRDSLLDVFQKERA